MKQNKTFVKINYQRKKVGLKKKSKKLNTFIGRNPNNKHRIAKKSTKLKQKPWLMATKRQLRT